MDPVTLLGALGPLLGKLGSAAIDRWIRPETVKPTSVDEVAKLAQIEIDRFRALNETNAAPSYPWVTAIIQLQRPVVVFCLIFAALFQVTIQGNVSDFIANALGVVGSYLFMDRSLFHLTSRK